MRTQLKAFFFICLLVPALVFSQDKRRPGQSPEPEADPVPVPAESAETEDIDPTQASAVLAEYARIAAGFAFEDKEERGLAFHRCKHVKGETMVRVLENFLTSAGTVAVSEEADLVVMVDTDENIAILKQVAEEMDKPVKQILVEARIIEFGIDTDFDKEVNLEFQKLDNVTDIPNLPDDYMDYVKRLTDAFVDPGANPLNTRGSMSYMRWDADQETLLTAFVRFLETRGKAQILSAPNLILRRGIEGNITTGEEVPIQTQTITSGSVSTSTTFKSVGVKLRVLPIMIEDGRVRLSLSPEVSNVTRYDEATGAPIIAVRNAQTEIEILDGQLISIGGLLRTEELERVRRVPILASIPILGHLFKGTSRQTFRSQLVIFLRVRVLDEHADQLPALRTLDLPENYQQELDAAQKVLEKKTEPSGMRNDLKEFMHDGATEAE